MQIQYDPEADAVYIKLSEKKYSYGVSVDEHRHIDFASDNTPIGIEIICVKKGMSLEGLPLPDDLGKHLSSDAILLQV